MSLLLVAPNRDMQPWEKALHSVDSDLDIEIWPDVAEPEHVQFAVAWRQPPHMLEKYPNLQAVSSMGAGVDHILQDETVPGHLSVSRLVSPSLGQQMKEYIFSAVLNYQRTTFTYIQQKHEGLWKKHINRSPEDMPIGLMGLGALGRPIARQLTHFGYTVFGWAKSQKDIKGMQTFAGKKELDAFLSQTAVLICLLPLTPETQGILDLELLKKLKRPGYLINVARGEHLVEEDLIYALDKGLLDGACLDVFTEEPLPEKHAFWNRENILITPHISSITSPDDVAPQIVENYKRLLSGMELLNEIDKEKGY